jgi:hypothetical protein
MTTRRLFNIEETFPDIDQGGGWCGDGYVSLKLWQHDYDTIALKLLQEFEMENDEASTKAILGTWIWEAHTKKFRLSFLKRLRHLGVAFRIIKVKGGSHMLFIGSDRIRVAMGITKVAHDRGITAEQKQDFLLRLARSEFPNPENDFEVGFEMDLLLSE